MKQRLLSLAMMVLVAGTVTAQAGGGAKNEEVQRKSATPANSAPRPFTVTGTNPKTQPAISTGYYIVDSEDNVADYDPQNRRGWRPSPNLVSLDFEPALWRRIVSGPKQLPDDYWKDNTNEGLRYFRNPADVNDSTDNAIAGPIPMNLSQPFYFNGIRYDSFYVSTNGLIALSNRRYFYDPSTGQRYIPEGSATAYDPESEDFRTRDPLNSMTDPIADDFGSRYIAHGLGSDAQAYNAAGTQANGIRNPNNGGLAGFTNNAPIIAPFWDDLQVSQFNKYTNQPDDYGQVWYKRSATGDKLIIYFVNLVPIGTKGTPYGNVTFGKDIRPGTGDNFVSVNAQIVLDASDSSVTYNYEVFRGIARVNNFPVPSQRIFRDNSTIGVRGRAVHVNYPPVGAPTRYDQYSEYLVNGTVHVDGPTGSALTTPNTNLAIRFKQWKNVLRTYSTKYVLRNPATNQFDPGNKNYVITDPNNFELLVGSPVLGAVQPVSVFQNLTNDIQGPNGVNFQQQNLQFRARFRVRNDIIGPDTTIYNRLICVDSSGLRQGYERWDQLASGVRLVDAAGAAIPFPGPNNLNGVPPYGFVEVKFSAFETNGFLPNHVGRLTAQVIAEPFVCGSPEGFNDQWPFDDTTSIRLFGLKRLSAFNDDGSGFSFSRREGPLPAVDKWVSINAEQVDGDAATSNPPPPRGRLGLGTNKLNSPVIRLNRVTLSGANPTPLPGGDELRSFPIDLRNKKGAVLSFSYQRTGVPPTGEWNRGWRDQTLFGPEPRVVRNTAPPHPDAGVFFQPDLLQLEFASPSPDGYKNIVNIAAAEWNKHPRMDDPGKFYTDNPAFTIFGAGGTRRGFSEDKPDSALSKDQGLRADLYDDGKERDFNKVFIQIPDTIINSPNQGAQNFRFRFRVIAKDETTPAISDDTDDFYVDNVRIFFRTESPDLEVASVQANWPYTMAPASQASDIPIIVKITNNTSIGASSFAVQTLIMQKDETQNRHVYCRSRTIPFLPANRQVDVDMPNWNARLTTPGDYILATRLYTPWGDPNRLNDSTYGEFTLTFGPAYAYDPINPQQGQNDVPDQSFSGAPGKGLNLGAFNDGSANWPAWAYGADAGNTSGQIAMRFTVTTQDTVRGYQAYFASLNSDMLNISFALYRDQGGVPGQRINGSLAPNKKRGFDDIRSPQANGEPFYDEYTTYTIAPVVLLPGTYWMSVGQRGTEGFELGASRSRMGQVTTYDGTIIRPGDANISLNTFRGFRQKNIQGNLINKNMFAYENTINSGTWTGFTPTVGNPAYAHLNNVGTAGGVSTYSRGSWIPLIRPYFGNRSFSNPPVYVDSNLCLPIVPVELANFDGVVRRNGIDLFWETATEVNNAGFHVERRALDGVENWKAITFVGGQGNSTSLNRYDYLDKDVVRGTTYEYRLRQVDFDGTESYSSTIEKTFGGADAVALQQNWPNPFADETTIEYRLPERSYAKVEITDVMGNVILTIVDGVVDAGDYSFNWNGLDAAGNQVGSGTYLCKLTQGDQVIVRKMSVIR